MSKTVLFAVGGTGGHLFPALATADALKKIDPSLTIVFAGGGLKNPKVFNGSCYSYHYVESASLSLTSFHKGMKNSFTLLKGWRKACRLLDSLSVSLVVGFGSHYSFPLLLAANWKKVPYILHEQNVVPGRVVRLFSKRALFTGLHFSGTENHLKGKCLTVGLPLRSGYQKGSISKKKALDYFSLKTNKPVLLLFGGSQGAKVINQLLTKTTKPFPFQILHFTGSEIETGHVRSQYQKLEIDCVVKEFEERMDFAWSAADFAITRAGGSSIAELVEFEVPSLIIPYPFAMDNHQEYNADFFVDRIGGGKKILEGEIKNLEGIDFLNDLMQPDLLERFKKNIENYKNQNKENNFAREIISALCPN